MPPVAVAEDQAAEAEQQAEPEQRRGLQTRRNCDGLRIDASLPEDDALGGSGVWLVGPRLRYLDRLRELVHGGEVGAVADTHYSIMGYQGSDTTALEAESAPAIAASMQSEEVDLAILAPV